MLVILPVRIFRSWRIHRLFFNLNGLDLIMRTLNQAEVAQVAGAALDPKLGLFPKTGIALIDNIHAGEWKLYGKPLYNIFAPLLGAPKAV
jgi:hypothetical protein